MTSEETTAKIRKALGPAGKCFAIRHIGVDHGWSAYALQPNLSCVRTRVAFNTPDPSDGVIGSSVDDAIVGLWEHVASELPMLDEDDRPMDAIQFSEWFYDLPQ